jgi:hypothetical protein
MNPVILHFGLMAKLTAEQIASVMQTLAPWVGKQIFRHHICRAPLVVRCTDGGFYFTVELTRAASRGFAGAVDLFYGPPIFNDLQSAEYVLNASLGDEMVFSA